jgi:hypothetical protein
MFNGTGLLYSVGVGEFMIICGGSVMGGIGVAEVPQVGLASATSTACIPINIETAHTTATRAYFLFMVSPFPS